MQPPSRDRPSIPYVGMSYGPLSNKDKIAHQLVQSTKIQGTPEAKIFQRLCQALDSQYIPAYHSTIYTKLSFRILLNSLFRFAW